MVYVTGDTHGGVDIQKLATKQFSESKHLTKDDYVIIAGDFGFIWTLDNKDMYWLKWFENKSFTTLFVDGNHENFDLLNKFPVENWKGGKVHRINSSVIHLMRGQVFNIDDKKIFTFGGAHSVDKMFRQEGISWWKEEMPSVEEYDEGIRNLEKNNWEVDFIITHTCPSSSLLKINEDYNNCKEVMEINEYFDYIEQNITFLHWYFGHSHNDALIKENQTLLYNNVLQIF